MRKHRMRKATVGIINWMNCIWLTDLPSNSKYLACYLRKFMNDNQDMAWPSYARMIEETGLARATVAKHLSLLESEGWIQRERGTGENTTYIARLPKALEIGVKNLDSSLSELVQSVNQGSSVSELELVQPVNTNKQVNKQGSKQDNNIDRFFEIFWKSGMRKVNKSGALKSFKKALKDEGGKCPEQFAKELANDVQRRIQTNQFGFDKMHPTTYLNQKRWNDEYETNQPTATTTSSNRKLTAVEENNARLLAKYGNSSTHNERTVNPVEHTGLDQHQISGGISSQVESSGITLDMDSGNICDDGGSDTDLNF